MSDKKSNRGFVILIVLAVIATASIVLATQLTAVEGQQGAEIRAGEDMKARGIAEYCLDVADAYVEAYGNANATSDFDAILDPNGTIEVAGDDFLPPTSLISGAAIATVVTVPPGASGSHYRWRGFNITAPGASGEGGTAGTCLIRYDDNQDDVNPLLPAAATSNTGGVTEGAGTDVPERDRDRTIITTVIGIVPQNSAADVYKKAHARVTVRRVRAMPLNNTIGAAIEAGGNVNFGGSICGTVAGVTADAVIGGACICGVLNAALTSGSQGTNPGDCGCANCASDAGSTTTAGARVDPVITVPAFTSLLQNNAFGDVGSATANNIAAASYKVAVVYFRDSTSIHSGVNTYVTDLYQPAASTDVFAWDAGDSDTLATLGFGGATQNCTDTSALDPLPKPCNWGNGAMPPTNITCAAGESPCWKLVARLDATASADIDIRAAQTIAEHADNASHFQPKTGTLPNFKTGTTFSTWAGLANSTCSTCGGTTIVTKSGADYTVDVGTQATGPDMIAVFDTPSSATVTLNGRAPVAEKVSVFTTAAVSITGETCCAKCTCGASCSGTAGFSRAANGNGYLIRTNKAASGSLSSFGFINAPQFDTGNSGCIVGAFALNKDPGTLDCDLPGTPGTAFCDHTATFCAKNDFEIVGDLLAAGNVCMKNNLKMNGGSIQSQENIGWKNNPVAAGQIRAGHDIVGKNNATVTFNGASGALLNQGIASHMWMDTTW